MDVVAYADIYTAFSEDRPYRKGMDAEQILTILKDKFVCKHGKIVFNIIEENLYEVDKICKNAVHEGVERFKLYEIMADEYNNRIPV